MAYNLRFCLELGDSGAMLPWYTQFRTSKSIKLSSILSFYSFFSFLYSVFQTTIVHGTVAGCAGMK